MEHGGSAFAEVLSAGHGFPTWSWRIGGKDPGLSGVGAGVDVEVYGEVVRNWTEEAICGDTGLGAVGAGKEEDGLCHVGSLGWWWLDT